MTSSGHSVSGGGDINGDGLDDLIIGASNGEITGGTTNAGSVYVLYGRADRAFGVNTKANASGANIKESDTTYATLTTPIRKVVFVSDLAMVVPPDSGTPAAALGTGEADSFTLASTTSGAGGGVLHHNGRAGIDTVIFTLSAGTLDFTEDTDGTGTSDRIGNAYNRFDSIERLDLTDSGAQRVILSRSAVHHMTDLRKGFEGVNGQTTIIVLCWV